MFLFLYWIQFSNPVLHLSAQKAPLTQPSSIQKKEREPSLTQFPLPPLRVALCPINPALVLISSLASAPALIQAIYQWGKNQSFALILYWNTAGSVTRSMMSSFNLVRFCLLTISLSYSFRDPDLWPFVYSLPCGWKAFFPDVIQTHSLQDCKAILLYHV